MVYPKQVGSMRLVDKRPAGGADAYLLDTHLVPFEDVTQARKHA